MRQPTYARRDDLLHKMGYITYIDYLSSKLWMKIRVRVLDRDERECRLCGEHAFTIHHLDYKKTTLLGTSLIGLVSLCVKCHNRVEFNRSGVKRTLLEAALTYRKLRKHPKSVIRRQNWAKKA
jgi:5-methylcytosine-specific restriction endonuclease McrA